MNCSLVTPALWIIFCINPQQMSALERAGTVTRRPESSANCTWLPFERRVSLNPSLPRAEITSRQTRIQ
ncbi:MAG TPA: hypothetical protein PLK80_12830, partial [bacterium]|nr:hypothetical protein [bacterium]